MGTFKLLGLVKHSDPFFLFEEQAMTEPEVFLWIPSAGRPLSLQGHLGWRSVEKWGKVEEGLRVDGNYHRK